MARTLMGSIRTGKWWGGVRGKCRYGPSHESVSLIGDQWQGESTGSFYCDLAPQDVCESCGGAGEVEVTAEEAALLQFDGPEAYWGDGDRSGHTSGRTDAWGDGKKYIPCPPCRGRGYVPGAHHPWRHPHPGPVRGD
jgi:hypothetical protein